MKASEIVEKVGAGYHRLVLGADGTWSIERARPSGGSFMPGLVVDAAEASTASAALAQMHLTGGLSAWYMPRESALDLVRRRGGRVWMPAETAAVRGALALLIAEGLVVFDGQFVVIDEEVAA